PWADRRSPQRPGRPAVGPGGTVGRPCPNRADRIVLPKLILLPRYRVPRSRIPMILTPPRPRSLSRRAILAALCLTLALPGLASAQRGGRGKGGFGFGGTNGVEIKAGDKFKALFRPVVAEAAKSTVRVRFEGKDFGLGVVVSADGYILTQAT